MVKKAKLCCVEINEELNENSHGCFLQRGSATIACAGWGLRAGRGEPHRGKGGQVRPAGGRGRGEVRRADQKQDPTRLVGGTYLAFPVCPKLEVGARAREAGGC